jgi:hypothetical protein
MWTHLSLPTISLGCLSYNLQISLLVYYSSLSPHYLLIIQYTISKAVELIVKISYKNLKHDMMSVQLL